MTKNENKISLDEIRRLGELAKLSMTAAEEERLQDELSSILEYFRTVERQSGGSGVTAAAVEPSELRGDDVGPSDPEGVMKGVPQRKGRLVKAPRVF